MNEGRNGFNLKLSYLAWIQNNSVITWLLQLMHTCFYILSQGNDYYSYVHMNSTLSKMYLFIF